jgi:perosamine synthetase
MLKRSMLIPRYNWDYGLRELLCGVRGLLSRPAQEMPRRLDEVVGPEPIFTISGRTSLYALLRGLKMPSGSNIGVPLFCCPVVFDAIVQAGHKPTFIDNEVDTFCLSAADLEKKVKSLSAVIVVHMFGHPADMDSINAVCNGRIPVIEDCAQSLFSEYKGRQTGFLSECSFFSFRAGKYISAGEGSAIVTRDPSLRDAARQEVQRFSEMSSIEQLMHCLSVYIKSTLYHRPWYGIMGYPVGRALDRKLNLSAKGGFRLAKVRATDIAVVANRLTTFKTSAEKQRQNALFLLDRLQLRNAHMPREKDECRSNYYQFALRFRTPEVRDLAADYLFRRGIDTAKYLDEIIEHSEILYGYRGDCPNSEVCSKTTLVIPHYYTLSRRALLHIAQVVTEADDALTARYENSIGGEKLWHAN